MSDEPQVSQSSQRDPLLHRTTHIGLRGNLSRRHAKMNEDRTLGWAQLAKVESYAGTV